jgi:hypothetical protein
MFWHPAISDKEINCESSSIKLTQVGLCRIRGMVISEAFHPLGLVLQSTFLVRNCDRYWVYLSVRMMVMFYLSDLNKSLTYLSY